MVEHNEKDGFVATKEWFIQECIHLMEKSQINLEDALEACMFRTSSVSDAERGLLLKEMHDIVNNPSLANDKGAEIFFETLCLVGRRLTPECQKDLPTLKLYLEEIIGHEHTDRLLLVIAGVESVFTLAIKKQTAATSNHEPYQTSHQLHGHPHELA